MNPLELHPWTLDPAEAIRIQTALRERLVLEWDKRTVSTIGGVDIGLQENTARAAIVVLSYPDLAPLEGVTADVPLVFPYVPGLLAFREGPAILAAWKKLRAHPDLLMFDGQGIAHPRGLGIASQMGLWLERPSIGVAKSRLACAWTSRRARRKARRLGRIARRARPKENHRRSAEDASKRQACLHLARSSD